MHYLEIDLSNKEFLYSTVRNFMGVEYLKAPQKDRLKAADKYHKKLKRVCKVLGVPYEYLY